MVKFSKEAESIVQDRLGFVLEPLSKNNEETVKEIQQRHVESDVMVQKANIKQIKPSEQGGQGSVGVGKDGEDNLFTNGD